MKDFLTKHSVFITVVCAMILITILSTAHIINDYMTQQAYIQAGYYQVEVCGNTYWQKDSNEFSLNLPDKKAE
jgi:hypothetical protein